MLSSSRVAVAIALSAASGACGDAITLEIAGDRPVPQGVDAICVGVADVAEDGGHFGSLYRLSGKLASLPQSLRLEPGGADAALAWVRGDRAGVPVARASAAVDFGGDVRLRLDRCPRGRAAAPRLVGEAVGPAAPRLVGSQGAGGNLVVALGAEAAVIDAREGAVNATPTLALPAGAVTAVIAADLDGDCDDDLVIATDAGPPVIWRRERTQFVGGGALDGGAVTALAAADVDRDGDLDLVTGGGGALTLWRNDGAGRFTRDAAAIAVDGRVSAVSALALADLDGDTNPDLVVGQAGGPLVAWLGDSGGTGSFLPADAAVPSVALDVVALVLVDADADFDPDLAVAVRGAPMRLYINRDGRLEDQSFVRLPQPPPVASAIAIGGWDDGCEPDAVIAGATESLALRGEPGGALAGETSGPAATDVIMIDLDDDGVLDAVLATAEGARWFAR